VGRGRRFEVEEIGLDVVVGYGNTGLLVQGIIWAVLLYKATALRLPQGQGLPETQTGTAVRCWQGTLE